MLPLTLFYSWQMDRPTKICRDFIRKALEEAVASFCNSPPVDGYLLPRTEQKENFAATFGAGLVVARLVFNWSDLLNG